MLRLGLAEAGVAAAGAAEVGVDEALRLLPPLPPSLAADATAPRALLRPRAAEGETAASEFGLAAPVKAKPLMAAAAASAPRGVRLRVPRVDIAVARMAVGRGSAATAAISRRPRRIQGRG